MAKLQSISILLILALSVTVLGCDSESLDDFDEYEVEVYKENGSLQATGILSLKFEVAEETICIESICLSHDISGRWEWDQVIDNNRSSGELAGLARSDGRVWIHLDVYRNWTDSGYSLQGFRLNESSFDFEGEIVVTTIAGAHPNGHTFVARKR